MITCAILYAMATMRHEPDGSRTQLTGVFLVDVTSAHCLKAAEGVFLDA